MFAINTLAPVVIIIFLGAVLRSTKFMTVDIFRANNSLVYWIALPCLLFYKTATASAQGTEAMRIFLILIGGMFVCIILGYLCAWLLHLPAPSRSAFAQGAYRGNLVYVGLPVTGSCQPGQLWRDTRRTNKRDGFKGDACPGASVQSVDRQRRKRYVAVRIRLQCLRGYESGAGTGWIWLALYSGRSRQARRHTGSDHRR